MLWKGSVTRCIAHFKTRRWQRAFFRIALASVFVLAAYVYWHAPVLAQTSQTVNSVSVVGRQAGLRSPDLYTLIGRIIYVFLSVLGLVFLGYLLYAGYLWMTGGEDTEKIAHARVMIQNAVIGLFIIGASFAITAFVLSRLGDVLDGGPSEQVSDGGGLSFPSAAGALGNRIVEYHLPERDATGVPRNTSIIVTFKEPIRLSSLIQGYDDNATPEDLTDDHATTTLNTATVHIVKVDGTSEEILPGDQVDVRFTEDRKTFVFKPKQWLGSASVNTNYRVELMPGRSGLLLADGSPAFGPESPSGYQWRFEVSTLVDLTPPKIVSIVPVRGIQPPNIIFQINFNEAVDPTSASGLFRGGRGFSNIEVSSVPVGSGSEVPSTRTEGNFVVSNRYQTVEFLPEEICGRNACGRDIHCLPRNAIMSVLAKAAQLSIEPPQALVVATAGGGGLYDGIVDVASNSLDGNGDGVAQGPALDSGHSAFSTASELDLTPPTIATTVPPVGTARYPAGSSEIDPEQKPQATFGIHADTPSVNILQASTVNSANIYITRQNEPVSLADTFWFYPFQTVLGVGGAPTDGSDEGVYGQLSIAHRSYARPLPTARAGTPPPVYAPVITSGVQNLLQNCFKPSAADACPATLGGPSGAGSPSCCNNRTQTGDCSFSSRTP